MNWRIYPIVEDDGAWNVRDDILEGVWGTIVEEKKAHQLFYDASVQTVEQFIKFIKSPGNFPLFVLDENQTSIHMLAWLNGLMNGTAQSHFCVLGRYRRGMAEAIVKYWMDLKYNGDHLIHALIGITPQPLEAAVKLAKIAGYTVLGTIPDFCPMRYEGKRVPGVISYYVRGGNGDGR